MDKLGPDLIAKIVSLADVSLQCVTSYELVCKQFHEVISSAHGSSVWKRVLTSMGCSVPPRLFYGATYKDVVKHVCNIRLEEARCRKEQRQYYDEYDWMECDEEFLDRRNLQPPPATADGQWKPLIDAQLGDHLVQQAKLLLELLRNFHYPVQRDQFDADVALRRYRQFLWLRRKYAGVLLVPTADIELCWVSHILRTDKYWADMTSNDVEPDHSLLLDESAIPFYREAITATSKLWRQHFCEEYLPEGFDERTIAIWKVGEGPDGDPLRDPLFVRPPSYCLAVVGTPTAGKSANDVPKRRGRNNSGCDDEDEPSSSNEPSDVVDPPPPRRRRRGDGGGDAVPAAAAASKNRLPRNQPLPADVKLPGIQLSCDDINGDFRWLNDLLNKFNSLDLDFWGIADNIEGRLRHLVGSYDRFLWLTRKYPDERLAPEVSVDLMWHAHQLEPRQYREWTQCYVGRHVRHNMFPLGPGKSAVITEDSPIQCLWKKEFGVLHTQDHQYEHKKN